jgi:hypothetical protein
MQLLVAVRGKAARRLAFRSKPYGVTDPFDLFTEVRKYQVRDVTGQITTPLLIMDPDDEQFFPGQPRQLYDLPSSASPWAKTTTGGWPLGAAPASASSSA